MRRCISILPLCLCMLLPFLLEAQVVPTVQEVDEREEKIEQVAQDVDESIDLEPLYQKLRFYSEHPININQADREELEDLTLLNEFQIMALLQHRSKHGKFIAIEELQALREFDLPTIRKIKPYIRISGSLDQSRPGIQKMLKYGQHNFLSRLDWIHEEKKGSIAPDPELENPPNYYKGSKYRSFNRYRFSYLNKLSVGFTAEKDAGEEFFKGSQKNGFDFYSAHLYVTNVGPFRKIALGDYELNYGQGLALWSGLAFGKSADGLSVKRNAPGIKPYRSVNEYLFNRGVAVSVGNEKFSADFFFSSKQIDANITAIDSISNSIDVVSSFQQSGFHRTENEIADKHAVREVIYGTHIRYNRDLFKVGATVFRSSYDAKLERNVQPYNQFSFSGNEIVNASVDYSWLWKNFSFFGETAISDNGGFATLNGLLISLDPRFRLAVLHRNYERDYITLYSNPIRESSNSNERGTYLGFNSSPFKRVYLSGYFDFFSHPWLRFGVDAPSRGFEYVAQLTYNYSKEMQVYVRVRQTNKERNLVGNETAVDIPVETQQNNYRLHVSYKVSPSIRLRNRIEFVNFNSRFRPAEKGFLIFQDIRYKPMNSRFSFDFRYALFDAETYNARIYAFENDVLYAYSIPAFYDRGFRMYLTTRYKVKKGVDLWFRWAQTTVTNRETLGTGLEEIDGNTRTQFKVQLRLEF